MGLGFVFFFKFSLKKKEREEKKKKSWETTWSNFRVEELLMVRAASACIPFLNQNLDQEGGAEHTQSLLNSTFAKKPCGCPEMDLFMPVRHLEHLRREATQ